VPGSDFLDQLPFRSIACAITQNLPPSREGDVLPPLEYALIQLASQLLSGRRKVALEVKPIPVISPSMIRACASGEVVSTLSLP